MRKNIVAGNWKMNKTFQEADELIARNGGKSFEDEFFAAAYLAGFVRDDGATKKMGRNALEFIDSQPNASDVVVSQILKMHQG